MLTRTRRQPNQPLRPSRAFAGLASVLMMAFMMCLMPTRGVAVGREQDDLDDEERFCSRTANLLSRACGHQVQDDYWIAVAICINVSDRAERAECNPRRPELVSIDGSFKAGRAGDKPGIIFRASPAPGEVYLEESHWATPDATEVLSTTYAFGDDRELDQFVPRRLAELLCSDDCLVTKNFSLLEPGIFARKYYAPGIGFFLEVNPDTGEVLQLVGCSFDRRCRALPKS